METVMRIDKMIAKENALIFHRILSTYSLKKYRYGDKCGEFMCGYWDLKS